MNDREVYKSTMLGSCLETMLDPGGSKMEHPENFLKPAPQACDFEYFRQFKGVRRLKSTFGNLYDLIPSSMILSVAHSSASNPVSYTFIRNCKAG